MTDWDVVYRTTTDSVVALGRSLSPEQLTAPVPATPAWTVRQVFAHLAGGPASILADDADDAPAPSWTERHVRERSDAGLEDLLAEIAADVDPVCAMVEGNPRPAIVWDRSVHLADLHDALGLAAPPTATWEPVLAAVRPMLADAVGDAEPPPYELFRAAFSRRSQQQLAALLPDAPAERLAAVGIFGPRDDDQPRPGDDQSRPGDRPGRGDRPGPAGG